MPEVSFQVEDTVEATENMGVRFDWFQKVIEKVLKAKDQQKLAHTANSIRERMEDLQRKLDKLASELK